MCSDIEGMERFCLELGSQSKSLLQGNVIHEPTMKVSSLFKGGVENSPKG
jgi:hypothetical protein